MFINRKFHYFSLLVVGWSSDFPLSRTYTWNQNIIHATTYLLWIPHLGSSVCIMFDWHDRKTFIRSFVSRVINAIIWISEFNSLILEFRRLIIGLIFSFQWLQRLFFWRDSCQYLWSMHHHFCKLDHICRNKF